MYLLDTISDSFDGTFHTHTERMHSIQSPFKMLYFLLDFHDKWWSIIEFGWRFIGYISAHLHWSDNTFCSHMCAWHRTEFNLLKLEKSRCRQIINWCSACNSMSLPYYVHLRCIWHYRLDSENRITLVGMNVSKALISPLIPLVACDSISIWFYSNKLCSIASNNLE